MPALTISAIYYSVSDTVEVELAIVEDDNSLRSTKEYDSIDVSLMLRDVVLASSSVSKWYINADFYFRTFFLHPSSFVNIEVEAVVETRVGDGPWRSRIPVLIQPMNTAALPFGDNAASTSGNGTSPGFVLT